MKWCTILSWGYCCFLLQYSLGFFLQQRIGLCSHKRYDLVALRRSFSLVQLKTCSLLFLLEHHWPQGFTTLIVCALVLICLLHCSLPHFRPFLPHLLVTPELLSFFFLFCVCKLPIVHWDFYCRLCLIVLGRQSRAGAEQMERSAREGNWKRLHAVLENWQLPIQFLFQNWAHS